MPFNTPLAVGSIYEITVGCYAFGQAGINKRMIVCNTVGAGIPPTEGDLADDLDDLFAPLYKAVMHGSATYYGVKVQKVYPAPVTIATVNSDNTGIGTAGADPMPGQVAGVITYTTDFIGRNSRGRNYIPFPAEADNSNLLNIPTDGYVARLVAIAAVFTDELEIGASPDNATLTWCLANTETGGTTELTGSRANQKWGTQRRRGDYGSKNPYPPV